MRIKQKRRLVESWLAMQRAPEPGIEREDLSWVVRTVWDICDHAPQIALQFIAGVLEADASATSMAILSAGPLEAVLRQHGPRIIHRIERRARDDPKFAALLGYVWNTAIAESVWSRIQRVRDIASH